MASSGPPQIAPALHLGTRSGRNLTAQHGAGWVGSSARGICWIILK
jgi:hypothetical protein